MKTQWCILGAVLAVILWSGTAYIEAGACKPGAPKGPAIGSVIKIAGC